ncbi:MAG TPA: sigma-70 family RNA polymerase sigma factor [Gemmataceae bacterium]|nr:sigma-70 family RNA polymerase sigma factor [Gemmataceae bacterium]
MPMFSRLSGRMYRVSRQPAQGSTSVAKSDGQLLERYVRGQDEDAFAELVERHSGLVRAVCRRVLNDEHAADDAFQATFLVLARRAGSLDGERTLAGWLYAVAHRTALKARAQAARRLQVEKQMSCEPASKPSSDQAWREFLPILDEELQRLPDKYRLPLILCYLEGKTHQEAAKELEWPSGSMSRRMARALILLRGRLQSRGVALPGVLLLSLLGRSGDPIAPTQLVASAVRGALAFNANSLDAISSPIVALARAVLRSMSVRRWRLWQLMLLVLSGPLLMVSAAAAAGVLPWPADTGAATRHSFNVPAGNASNASQPVEGTGSSGGCSGAAASNRTAPVTSGSCHAGGGTAASDGS